MLLNYDCAYKKYRKIVMFSLILLLIVHDYFALHKHTSTLLNDTCKESLSKILLKFVILVFLSCLLVQFYIFLLSLFLCLLKFVTIIQTILTVISRFLQYFSSYSYLMYNLNVKNRV